MVVNENEKKQSAETKDTRQGVSSFLNSSQKDAAKSKSNLIEIPSISLPKSSGAIKSIDDKFSVNPSNGTASFSIPLPLSPGRNGSAPSLGLSYNSGGGNSPFGLGWDVSFPMIQRKTEKKLPEYLDDRESDTFIYSGVEDLVPEIIKDADGNWAKHIVKNDTLTITHYRPRIEGSFARIEKIEEKGNVYWRVRTRDNIVSVFGKSDPARLSSPVKGEENKIFSWCLEYSYDDKGNFVYHHYKKENKENVTSSLFEKNRLSGNAPFTNIYLKRIQYGNQSAFYEGDELPKNFLFELVFDFGEHDEDKPTVSEIKAWRCRKDPFSDYRAGFEIRTYRLCKRVLMFHHFKEELGLDDYLVRSLQFVYDERPHLTYLDSVIQSGYIWEKNGVLRSKESLPPFSFTYIKPGYSNEVKTISHENLINAPVGIDNQQYIWTDLYNEGISGILTEQGNGWYYKENLGNGEFAAAKLVSPRPSFNGLNSGTIALQDLEANGKKHLVSTGPYIKGFFEMGEENDWKPFQYFETYPNIDLRNPDLKFVDLTGDGLVDMLLTNHEGFTWYASKGKGGYDDAEIAFKSHDEEKGPKIYFSDPDKLRLVAIADMNGDGLGDIVLVTYNSVSYYPNLGYGRFGARVSLPLDDCIANFSNFNPRYIHFADVDGSGTTDIIYTGNDKIQVWFNQSGNSLSKVFEFLNPFPELDNFSEIEFVDLLGNGTSCLVWSSSLPAHSHAPLRYIDLMGGRKPHVMKGMKNNLGKEVKLEYRSSTQYYLEDKKRGEPWVTKLPFPVQCVSKVVIEDKVAETRFANEYSFHHGYYDCVEREFRGFARVEQRDSESYEHYVKETNAAGAVNTVEKELYQPTVITKSWFHTGAFINREKIFHFLEGEYYSQDKFKNIKASDKEHLETIKQYKLSEPLLPAHLTHAEMHEWCRALKGLPLRQEVYSEEGDEQIRMHPYSVIQNNHDIQILQPRLEQKHAVFLSHEKEKLSLYYERNPFDPRIAHTINVEIDQYGNVLQSASIAYGRLKADLSLPTEEDRAKQTRQNIIYNQHSVTATIDRDDAYRLPVPLETQAWELNTGRPSKALFEADDIKQRFEQAAIRSYEEETAAGEKRKIEHSRTLFLKNDLTGPMPFGEMDSLALPFENYLLAFTPSLVQHIYGDKYDEKLFREKAGYVRFGDDDNFWIRSGRIHFHVDLSLDIYAKTINAPIAGYTGFAQSNFYLPVAHEDNFGNLTKSFYDKNKLFVQKIVDAKDNEVSVDAFNYRVMAAYLARDPNDNRTGVRFDALGRVIRTFLMGKENEYLGDPMDVESDELSEQDQPTSVIEYQLRYFESKGKKPNRVKASKRENHFYDLNKNDVWHEAYSYSDGSGHEVLKKIQAEPGMAPERDKEGKLIFDETGKPRQKDTSPALRWVGSGKVIYNNKGPVKQYEPYFDNTWEFNNEEELVKLGYTSIIYYDALSRVIKTEKPNGTYSKMEFNAWGLKTYDENDTAGSIAPVTGLANTDWYKERISGAKGKAEQEAAQKTVLHYNTPTSISLDSQIRPYLSKAHNKTQRDNEAVLEEFYYTRTELTIEGNARYTRDARGNVVMSWKYDIVGNICYQHSMDAGDRSILTDVIGNPIRLWDSRQQSFTYEYDELRRLISICVDTGNEDMLFEKYEYGENNSDAKKKNLKGKLHHHYDMAGLVTNEVYDFKGNLLASVRQLLKDYRKVPDWKCNPILEVDAYKGKNIYDGFNRTIKIITPDGSIFTPGYNEAGLLKSIIVNIKGSDTPTEFVKDIYYNAKRQREEIFYSNQTRTRYKYDEKTYRLIEIFTTGDNGNRILQNLYYTYDPVGNILLQDRK